MYSKIIGILKMGRKHSELMMLLFPNQKGIGVDLGNIEIKETIRNLYGINIRQKDKNCEFLLCYNHNNETFYLVDRQDIPFPIKKRSKGRKLSWKYINKMAIWSTNDEIEMLELLKPFLKNPELYIQI